MIVCGIDPGVSGAIAFISQDSLIDVVDMPTAALGKKTQVDAGEFTKLLKKHAPAVAAVERVSAMPGQGVASMFNFGMGYGVIQGALAALEIPTILVTPPRWKKRFSLIGKEKDKARLLAQQLYPIAELHRKRDIGRADALLIARYAMTSGQWDARAENITTA